MFLSARLRKPIGLVTLAVASLLHSCGIDHRTTPAPASLPNRPIYLLTNNNQLVQTNVNNLASQTTQSISGLTGGEKLLSIDFRPATGQLYALSDQNRLYTINPATAAANFVTGINPASNIGTVIGFDFNPTVDLLRVVTANNLNLNLRINPVNGVATTDTPVRSSTSPRPQIGAVAYTNNTAGATTTVLYDVDPVTDQLYTQNPANSGVLTPVGSLGIDISAVGGFDIAPSGEGLMTITYQGQGELSSVNLATGFLQKLGNLPGGIIGLAIPTNPVAYATDFNASSSSLLIFNPTQANPTLIRLPITGLGSGEQLYSIDFRPKNGQLYGHSNKQLYTINVATGAATPVGSTSLTLSADTSTGFDFNPVTDQIRLIDAANDTNYSLNPDTGTLTRETDINGNNTPHISGAAYSTNYAGATTTTLFTVGSSAVGGTATLYAQAPPSSGTQQPIGNLGPFLSYRNGFDIGGQSNMAYLLAINFAPNMATLYRINLSTGAATQTAVINGLVGNIGGFALGLGF